MLLVGAAGIVTADPASAAAPRTFRAAVQTLKAKPYQPVKGFSGAKYGRAWADIDGNGCDTMNDILWRDLARAKTTGTKDCKVVSGTYLSALTGKRGAYSTQLRARTAVTHVVTKQQAWRSGAKLWSPAKRMAFANDPLNLVTADAKTSAARGNKDLTGWKPVSKGVACRYAGRRAAVMHKYALKVTPAELALLKSMAKSCDRQPLLVGGAALPGSGRGVVKPPVAVLADGGTGVNVPARPAPPVTNPGGTGTGGSGGTGGTGGTGTTPPSTGGTGTTPPSNGGKVPDPIDPNDAKVPQVQADGSLLVSTDKALDAALTQVKPGGIIRLADAVFDGTFTAEVNGLPGLPIRIIGSRNAKITNGTATKGTALTIEGDYYIVEGFTVHSAERGILVSSSVDTEIRNVEVYDIGNEGIHFRAASSGGGVFNSFIHDTGRVAKDFGEGVYIGSAVKHWGSISSGVADRSDRVTIDGNTFQNTTAEGVDIKEGTSGGWVRNNRFLNSGRSNENSADSWIDVKGYGWTVSGNTGDAPLLDAIQVHAIKDKKGTIIDGSGDSNTFTGNRVEGSLPRFVVYVEDTENAVENSVDCSNSRSDGSTVISNLLTC